jgi:hypothetical protein
MLPYGDAVNSWKGYSRTLHPKAISVSRSVTWDCDVDLVEAFNILPGAVVSYGNISCKKKKLSVNNVPFYMIEVF